MIVIHGLWNILLRSYSKCGSLSIFSIREYFSKLFAYYLLLKAKVKRGW